MVDIITPRLEKALQKRSRRGMWAPRPCTLFGDRRHHSKGMVRLHEFGLFGVKPVPPDVRLIGLSAPVPVREEPLYIDPGAVTAERIPPSL